MENNSNRLNEEKVKNSVGITLAVVGISLFLAIITVVVFCL